MSAHDCLIGRLRNVGLAVAIAGSILPAGCASSPPGEKGPNGKPPLGATMQEVRNQTGLPNAMRFLDSGEDVWEFNDRRVAMGAWRVVFERNGKVREVVPIRTQEDIARLKAGETTAREVLDWLGEPRGVSFVGPDAVWEYRQPDGEHLRVRFGTGKRVQEVALAPK